ncbi:hypothetical protein B0T17DRAFT_611338 [Bombardia bombarda]|uniref:Peptidase M3A/M3B catalytic domain-containing protein n=1 Tax=Bombardia bombarda TaxID=252184 RepID=A0AA40CED1_9PEZI|nr:hypothetical protein B0T17DRAFT_611338 [Bombardia bombarda]
MSTYRQPLPRIPTAAEIPLILEDTIRTFNSALDKIASSVATSSAKRSNVIVPWTEAENITCTRMDMMHHLASHSPDASTRSAAQVAKGKIWASVRNEVLNRKELRSLLEAVNESLDDETSEWLSFKLKRFKEHLEEDEEDTSAHQTKLSALQAQFKQLGEQDDDGIWLTEKELDGVPLRTTRLSRKPPHEPGPKEGPNAGKVFVQFSIGTSAVLRSAHNPETRKKVYLERERRKLCTAGAPLHKQIIVEQDSIARKDGGSNYVEYRAKGTSVPSSEWVNEFLERLKGSVVPYQRMLTDAIRARRVADQKLAPGTLHSQRVPPWDYDYYCTIIQNELIGDASKLDAYIAPPDETLPKLWSLLGETFQLHIKPVPAEKLNHQTVWDTHVRVCEVWDKEQQPIFLGYIYYDIFAGQGHSVDNSKQYTSILQHGYERRDGTRTATLTVVNGYWPLEKRFLPYDHLRTIVHETGHALHLLSRKAKHVNLTYNSLPSDFAELPGYFLENHWFTQRAILRKLCTRHWSYSDPNKWKETHPKSAKLIPKDVPDSLFDMVFRYGCWKKVFSNVGSIHALIFDTKINSLPRHEDVLKLDLQTVWYETQSELYDYDHSETIKAGGHGYLECWHLIEGQHNGRGYSHMLGKAMAADIWRRKFAANPNNPAEWKKYRKVLLVPSLCGTSDKSEFTRLLEGYLGRRFDAGSLFSGSRELDGIIQSLRKLCKK